MVEFVAVLPHAAGGFQAEEVAITGTTKDDLYSAAWSRCIGSRYVGSIVAIHERNPVTVYTESSGWMIDDPTDESQLSELAKK